MGKTKVPIVAIVGRANVGKSSIFNLVIGKREAIVAEEPGTTRDSITARALFGEHQFWVVDTAGMKQAEDDFELTIQEQIIEATAAADVILVVVEAHIAITDEDRRVAMMALKSKKPVILIVNKADQAVNAKKADFQRLGIKDMYFTNVPQRMGFEEVFDKVIELIPKAVINEDDNRLYVALLGRPNVGKSALFNALAKKQQAIVADRAGTTRDINRAVIRFNQREIELMDTAGIRRSGKIEVGVEKFSVLRSLQAIEQADVCFFLMDANELNTQLDQKIAGLIKEAGKGLVIVITKWDSVDKDPYLAAELMAKVKYHFQFAPFASLVFTSSVSGQNVSKLFELACEIDAVRKVKIKTSTLNTWLRHVIDRHPPSGLKSRQPKINYMTQTDDATPTFKLFGAHTAFLHWSYKRHIEKELRREFGYEGTPIMLKFIEKHVDRKKGLEDGIDWKSRLRPEQVPKKSRYAHKGKRAPTKTD